MRRGISPIVAVVLLIAIAIVSAVGLYFWAGGIATKQPTPNVPIVITATPIKNTAGELGLIIANLGSVDIPAGTMLYTSNGASTNLTNGIPASQQARATFWGGYDGSSTTSFTSGSVVVYGSGTGSTVIPLSASDPVTGGDNATADADNETGGMLSQDSNGLYWMVFEDNDDIFLMNSTDGTTWDKGDAMTVYAADTNQDPELFIDGTTIHIVWSTNNHGEYDIMYRNYTGAFGSTVTVDPDVGKVETEPTFLKGSDGTYWIFLTRDAVGGSTICQTNSTDGGATWAKDTEVIAPAPFTERGSPSAIQASNGDYYLLYWTLFPGQLWLDIMSGATPNSWGGSEHVNSGIRQITSLSQDNSGNFLVSFSNVTGTSQLDPCDGLNKYRAYAMVSADGTPGSWSEASRVTDEAAGSAVNEIAQSFYQDDNGVYWLTYLHCGPGIDTDIVVKHSTDPLIWI